jgi:hypothetical protein
MDLHNDGQEAIDSEESSNRYSFYLNARSGLVFSVLAVCCMSTTMNVFCITLHPYLVRFFLEFHVSHS